MSTTLPVWLGWGAIGLIGAAAATGAHVAVVAAAMVLGVVIVSWHRTLLSFEAMIIAVVAVIFLIPIKRYTLPGNLPFELEPYRVLVALVVGAWFVALLVDDRVRLRRTPLDAPVLAVLVTIFASVAANGRYISSLGVATEVVKSLTFFVSFFLLYVLCTSTLVTRRSIDLVIKVLVGAGSFVGLATMYEYRTGNNIFNHLSQVFPVLRAVPLTALGLDSDTLSRSGRLRVYSSAQHPIALAAVLIMLVPLAFYLWKRSGNRIWLAAGGMISLGALGTLSRTGVVMALVVAIVFLVLRYRESVRLLPYAVPALVLVFVALPNALGGFYSAFFPKEGLIAEQSNIVATNDIGATGRLGDIGPWWQEVSRTAPGRPGVRQPYHLSHRRSGARGCGQKREAPGRPVAGNDAGGRYPRNPRSELALRAQLSSVEGSCTQRHRPDRMARGSAGGVIALLCRGDVHLRHLRVRAGHNGGVSALRSRGGLPSARGRWPDPTWDIRGAGRGVDQRTLRALSARSEIRARLATCRRRCDSRSLSRTA